MPPRRNHIDNACRRPLSRASRARLLGPTGKPEIERDLAETYSHRWLFANSIVSTEVAIRVQVMSKDCLTRCESLEVASHSSSGGNNECMLKAVAEHGECGCRPHPFLVHFLRTIQPSLLDREQR